MASDGTTFSAEEYFSTQDSPSNLQDSIDGVRSFVTAQQKAGHKVVLVTVSLIAGYDDCCTI